jgi:hypothetical protein
MGLMLKLQGVAVNRKQDGIEGGGNAIQWAALLEQTESA